MQEKPKITVARSRRPDSSIKGFAFSHLDLPDSKNGLGSFRSSAWEEFTHQPFPSSSMEAWRRTDLRFFPSAEFGLPKENATHDLSPVPDELLKPLIGDRHAGQITLLPGSSHIELDQEVRRKGVIFTDLVTAEREHGDLLKSLIGTIVRPGDGKFAALASAMANSGIFLYVPKGLNLEWPLHSLMWGPGGNLAYFSHIVIFVADGASITYIHESASPDESQPSMHAGIVSIHVGQEARFRFVELQSWGRHIWNFSHERAQVNRGGNLDWIFGAVGSKLTKNFSDLDLVGEGALGRMSGFYFTDGNQHLDHDTQQNHLAPNTTSDLLFKGALKGKSRSVWQGMIYVAPGAQKTDGYQANRNLVLDDQARADSIPGLEILADDVRCTHGATVGKLEQEPLFYLKSRGIPQREAEKLVVEGFFDPIMQRIPLDGVRERFQKAIHVKLSDE
ncbi:MAG: Fe-S cluster assembly protein SufD [Chloroflexi bacterium]|nr:Fe-S cluster assembly protein SufD [Chloroflexota bacterium]